MNRDYLDNIVVHDDSEIERTEKIDDDEVTGCTERIDMAIVGGRFEIILDVKKVNTTKSIDD
ncbi:MAG: hypothetical protein IJH60_01780 [Eubacterium sp.]|nr:hypothetical protein [Eubacterium sp.]